MNRPVILATFSGLGLLDLAFSEVFPEASIVRAPDVIYGSLHDIRTWHAPHAWGVLGGPPCQIWSRMKYINPLAGQKHGNLIPEFERICAEASPDWWLMENVPQAPEPKVPGYVTRSLVLNNRWCQSDDGMGAEQNRTRRFSFGTRDGRALSVELAAFEAPLREYAVTSSARPGPVALIRDGKGGHRTKTALRAPTVLSGHGAAPGQRDALRGRMPGADCAGHTGFPDSPEYSIAEMCRLQGIPSNFADEVPLTAHGKRKLIGNGVPVFTGRAIAQAVRRALCPVESSA
ncbi:MAG TPA: DNA cytosine methyltransferase [Chloroflexota bacterium]|nr:DNA cytosine methyltransferase [Chloroflexota bacterium]